MVPWKYQSFDGITVLHGSFPLEGIGLMILKSAGGQEWP